MFSTIVDVIKEATDNYGSFVKLDLASKRWYEVGDSTAREKVGQLFREISSQRDPLKKQARKERRKKLRQAKRHQSEDCSSHHKTTSVHQSTPMVPSQHGTTRRDSISCVTTSTTSTTEDIYSSTCDYSCGSDPSDDPFKPLDLKENNGFVSFIFDGMVLKRI